ncbi:sodium- and chloride-dependent glycine transporter 2-like [Acanthaster planci]|uniref:Transporter n=1 Tax=Acanthaster planci TaxID=133434 RepID=A0A8B7Y785_ACAPL|nr:sodium- and chloride-dependent glycine transporter 2-like [Acanthaster planci]XP_022089080.1 sodium- and chloride-dependent glycine transporter 2-like [Acanthaster planci]
MEVGMDSRPTWSSKREFFLACLGWAVGLGNVWRFPYLCFENGGGAFLIPYFLALFLAGLPTFFLDVVLGQYSSVGCISVWRAVPLLKGLGFSQTIYSFIVGSYYNVVITYSVFYFFASLTSSLPWTGCGHEWNTALCGRLVSDCLDADGVITFNNTCQRLDALTEEELGGLNVTSYRNGDYDMSNYSDPFSSFRRSASEEYWRFAVLQESASMEITGGVIWQLALCLLFTWIVVFLCVTKGIKSSGKAVYFTAIFPYVCLFVLLIRGVTLPGYQNGVAFFVTPRWDTLMKPKVWLDAVGQIFFSLGSGSSGTMTLGSYNTFHNNCLIDGLVVPLVNSATSFFAGIVIFSILGYMAHAQGKNVRDVVSQGYGLAFVAYPDAVSRMPGAPFWSALFFFMLFILGLDTQFVIIEQSVTGLVDEFSVLRRHRWAFLLCWCLGMFLLGLIFVTNAGPYWLAFVNAYTPSIALIVFVVGECLAVSWLYGIRRLLNDIRSMIGDKVVDCPLFKFYPVAWAVILPVLLLVVVIFEYIARTEPEYNGPLPPWSSGIGWTIFVVVLIWIPLWWVYAIMVEKGTLKQRLRLLVRPRDSWGPALPQNRLHAWEVHMRFGTTMGGKLYPDRKEEHEDNHQMTVRYSSLPEVQEN